MEPIKKLKKERDYSEILCHLKKYVDLCIEMGASDAAIITKESIFLDPRARLKCIQPKCVHYGTSANCPPYIPDIDFFKKVIDMYYYATIFRFKLPLSKNTDKDRQHIAKVVKAVEDAAFYDGYYFAVGFGAGNCKKTWCPNLPCQALELGKGCRHPLLSRISMEAAGFDVFKMVTHLGWDIYPIGRSCPEDKVPFMNRVGIILIV